MLREQSIAHNYWTKIINRIEKEERAANKQFIIEETDEKQVVQSADQANEMNNKHEYVTKK